VRVRQLWYSCSYVSARVRQILLVLLLASGVRLWVWLFTWQQLHQTPFWLVAVAGVAAIAALAPRLRSFLERTAHRADGWLQRRSALLIVAGIVAAYLCLELWRWHSQLFLKLHDEHVYMIQARMLLQRTLWMPAYPPEVRPFFDSIYLITDRVYAGMYFPGTALALAPVIGIGMPYWIMTLAATILAAVFFYLISAEMFGAARAVVALLMFLSLGGIYTAAMTLISIAPFLAAIFLMIWAWMRFRANHRRRWAILIGAAAGFAAIVRPLDALCFTLPVGVAMVVELWRKRALLGGTIAIVVAAASPLLALQVAQNIGVTGSWSQTAEGYYFANNYPAPVIGFYPVNEHVFLQNQPHWKRPFLDWILFYYRQHHWRTIDQWGPLRIQQLLLTALAVPAVAIFIPLGLLTLGEPRRAVIAAGFGLFVIAYMFNVFNLNHYMIPAIAPVIWLVLMGWDALDAGWPRWRAAIGTFMLVTLLGTAAMGIGVINRPGAMDSDSFQEEKAIDQRLASLPRTPAIVIFRAAPAQWAHDDPVYNTDTAWPDDAIIIRARDMDGHNEPLYRYYAAEQPDRVVYLYDRGKESTGQDPLQRLGTVQELSRMK
jgi:hypothetical protein